MVTNEQIARVLYEIADYLEVEGIRFKPEAYREAAKFVEHYREELADVYKRGGEEALIDLPEIGPSMAKKIAELIDTGKLAYLEKMRKKLPVDMAALNAIEGIGPKTIVTLFKKLKVRTIEDIKKVAKKGLIHSLPGFGKRSEEKILKSLGFEQAQSRRRPRREVEPIAKNIVKQLKKVPEVEAVEIAGSLRRKTPTVGDVDFIAASRQPEKVIEAFVNLLEVERVYSKGITKALVRLKVGIDADLRVVPPESFGAAMQYFTGPKEHSIATRQYARDRGMKLNEYGLFKGKKNLASKTEKDIYDALGLKFEKPEERSGKLVKK